MQGEAQDSYRFYGNAGELLRVQVAGDNLIAALHYLGKGHDTLNAAEQVLPEGGQYELRLALNRAAARRGKAVEYRVGITLEGRAVEQPASAQDNTGSGLELPFGLQLWHLLLAGGLLLCRHAGSENALGQTRAGL